MLLASNKEAQHRQLQELTATKKKKLLNLRGASTEKFSFIHKCSTKKKFYDA